MNKMKSKSESGLAHIVLLILILLVIGVVFFVGMRVVEDQNTGETTGSASVASTTATVPGTIKNVSDLNAAQASLNQTNVDSDLNPDSLNADLNSVL
jgi:uncharacterized protein (UPF0333 family)